jgi:hypothetical protein
MADIRADAARLRAAIALERGIELNPAFARSQEISFGPK